MCETPATKLQTAVASAVDIGLLQFELAALVAPLPGWLSLSGGPRMVDGLARIEHDRAIVAAGRVPGYPGRG